MNKAASHLLLGALPAIAASFYVLEICAVGRGAWAVQGASLVMMLAAPLVFWWPIRRMPAIGREWLAWVAVAVCVLPLLAGDARPARWIRVGPMALYLAPVVIPALLVLAARASRWSTHGAHHSTWWLWAAAVALACQPDLSQVLALSVGAAFIVARRDAPGSRRFLWLGPFAASVCMAALQPDPLQPVAHVEHVIAVAWTHSVSAGVGVSGAAAFLVATLAVSLGRLDLTLLAVPAYYSVLFMCSMFGLTPAPLIGYGAGPVLGVGVLAAAVAHLDRSR